MGLYLSKMPEYIKWKGVGEINMCITGSSEDSKEVAKAIQNIIEQKKLRKKVRLTTNVSAEGIADCQMLYIGDSDKKKVKSLTEEAHQHNVVVTYTGLAPFKETNALIGFYLKDGKHIKMQLNHAIYFEKFVDNPSVEIRSTLLSIMKIVK